MMFARIWLFCLAVTLGGCTHDAPALFGPATEDSLTPNERLRLPLARAARDLENAQPRYINRAAIDSDVIIVELEGKKHRFVGALTSANRWTIGADSPLPVAAQKSREHPTP